MPESKPQRTDRPRPDQDATLKNLVDHAIANPCLKNENALINPARDQTAHADALDEYTGRIKTIRKSDVHMFTLKGQHYVMKFNRPAERTRRRAWASSALCGALFGKFPSPRRLLPGDVRHEASRLRTLGQQGVRVPHVYLVTDDHLVLEHSGENIERTLKSLTSDKQRTQLLWQVVNDLIEFHRAGHWHGGAQIRNLTLKNGSIYRIDFEEQVGAALPLPYAQAFDVLLAFNSLVDHLHDDDPTLGVKLLTHYLDHAHSPQVIKTLQRLEYWLDRILRIEPCLTQRLRAKPDVQRTRKFASILNGSLS